jgi:hypothetical protein
MGDVQQPAPPRSSRGGGGLRSAVLVASGLLAGGIIAGTLVANATTDSPSDGAAVSQEDRRGHRDEQPLTGETAERVTEAALAEYPGADVRRVETDSDGIYEAHLTTADGRRVTVEMDRNYRITGTEERRRDRDRDGD